MRIGVCEAAWVFGSAGSLVRLRFGAAGLLVRLRFGAAALLVLSSVSAQPAGYGEPLAPAPRCLGSELVSGVGSALFCLDVPGPASLGHKVVVRVTTPRPAEIVRIGEHQMVRSTANTNTTSGSTVGPIIEVKPFQQSCSSCDTCPCVGPGCGERCECSCNAACRLRHEPTCAHTVGVLSPGRWFVGIDAPGAFTLQATLVAALALRPGEPLRRTIFGVGASRWAFASSSSEGVAFSDYFYYNAAPHESLELRLELLRTGSAAGWIEVYVRYGEWPTVELHDASMTVRSTAEPTAHFALAPDRLINERLCVLVVGYAHTRTHAQTRTRAHARTHAHTHRRIHH